MKTCIRRFIFKSIIRLSAVIYEKPENMSPLDCILSDVFKHVDDERYWS